MIIFAVRKQDCGYYWVGMCNTWGQGHEEEGFGVWLDFVGFRCYIYENPFTFELCACDLPIFFGVLCLGILKACCVQVEMKCLPSARSTCGSQRS